MRHAPLGILAIISIVGITVMLLSVDLYSRPAPFAVTYIGKAPAMEHNTVIVRLEINEYLSNEINSLTESHLAGLRSGTVHGTEGATDYTQILRFGESGLFDGGRVVFLEGDASNDVGDFLEFQDAIFKYQIEFGSGLVSKVDDGELPDIEDEEIDLLGESFAIVDTDVDTTGNRISLRLFGGFGSIDFEDNNYADDAYSHGVNINGKSIDADVKIKAVESGNELIVYSISYVLNANAAEGGTVQVEPLHCTREYLQYPLGLLTPGFDICYKGLGGASVGIVSSGISGNEVRIRPSGDDEYVMTATNTRGQTYKIPLAQNPGSYGNDGRDLIFVEAANSGAPNIDIDDYFLVNSKNDVTGSSHVLRYDSISGNTVYFEDLAGSQREVTFDTTTMEGTLLVGDGSYRFVVGAGNSLAMDQTNDDNINSGEARFVFAGGSRADLGPGFTVSIITPSKLFDENPGDETTTFDILFGGDIDLDVPSPQGAVFELQGENGRKLGLTQYGILFDWDTDSESDSLTLTIPGAYQGGVKGGSGGEVYITLHREEIVKQVPASVARCGDGIITAPEVCDPFQSLCAGNYFERGTCSNDCKKCVPIPKPVCGNNLIETSEDCEKNVDCESGKACSGCKCVVPEPAVCGNNKVDFGEECEVSSDCTSGYGCNSCDCIKSATPAVQMAAPAPSLWERFTLWLSSLFTPKTGVLCASVKPCRIWDNSCGGEGLEMMAKDGVHEGCVDAKLAASQGVDYCSRTVISSGSEACNSGDGCVCG